MSNRAQTITAGGQAGLPSATLADYLADQGQTAQASGFTLIELLVVIGVVSILASILLPALGRAKVRAQGAVCSNHLKQMTLGWLLYAEDNNNVLLAAAPWALAGNPNLATDWTAGNLMTLSDPHDENNWNSDKFTKRSPLWPYSGRADRIWTCPSDTSRAVDSAGRRVPRIRSFSMNNWIGGPGLNVSGPWVPKDRQGWVVWRRLTEFIDPGPAQAFLFLDERADSIDDGCFFVDMRGYDTNPMERVLSDYPAGYHNRMGNLSFVDGHVEGHRWVDARTTPPLSDEDRPLGVPSPGNADVGWLEDHATRRVRVP